MCMHFSERRFAEFTLFESEENGRRKSSVSLPHIVPRPPGRFRAGGSEECG